MVHTSEEGARALRAVAAANPARPATSSLLPPRRRARREPNGSSTTKASVYAMGTTSR